METRKKRTFLNFVMVLLAAVVIVSGVAVTGSVKGWFKKGKDSLLVSTRVSGVVNIQRSGIGYSLGRDVGLSAEDTLEVKKGSLAEVRVGEEDSFSLNENTEMKIEACQSDAIKLNVVQGEIFADVPSVKDRFTVLFGENEAEAAGAVFGAGAQPGSAFLCVFDGEAQVTAKDGTQEHVEAGEYLSISENASGTKITVSSFRPDALNEFQILQAKNCGSSGRLFVSAGELQKVLDDREAEKQAALTASLSAGVIPAADRAADPSGSAGETGTGTEPARDSYEMQQEPEFGGNSGDGGSSGNGGNGGNGGTEASGEDLFGGGQEFVQSGEGENQEELPAPAVEETMQCTITILCDTILDHLEDLSPGKEIYVPDNGCILAASTVEFTEGETVFDVLNRVCSYADIQLEYSWTPMYGSYYVEGINHIYEFDCGNESGWMFKVNGWFPNYGCSSYYLEDGDNIVWQYTCSGLGADIGGGVY